MGVIKEEPRYEVLSARVTDRELLEVQAFANDRQINISTATRMLINIGMRALSERLP